MIISTNYTQNEMITTKVEVAEVRFEQFAFRVVVSDDRKVLYIGESFNARNLKRVLKENNYPIPDFKEATQLIKKYNEEASVRRQAREMQDALNIALNSLGAAAIEMELAKMRSFKMEIDRTEAKYRAALDLVNEAASNVATNELLGV